MQSKATSVEAYLAELPPDRREQVSALRAAIRAGLGAGYQEKMQYGMIGYSVPHTRYPDGYHCDPRQPLPLAGLASQKHGLSLYLMGLYIGGDGTRETGLSAWFRKAWTDAGKKLDMGKACVRVKRIEDVPLDVVTEAFRRLPVETYIEMYEQTLALMRERRPVRRPARKAGAVGKPVAKSVAKKFAGKVAGKGVQQPGTGAAKKATVKAAKRVGKRVAKKASRRA
jgi:hypothetical protein